MRTGSVGNRTVDDMVKTLVEPKKAIISSVREKLIALNFSEEVEFDPIEIEPVIIYSLGGKRRIFLKHKWATVALLLFDDKETGKKAISNLGLEPSRLEANNEDGTTWIRFELPVDGNRFQKALTTQFP